MPEPLRCLRYQLTPADRDALRARLSPPAVRRVHKMVFSSYRGGSPFSLLYFDNDPSYLTLEQEDSGTSAIVTEAECRALLSGETAWLQRRYDPVLTDFYNGITYQMLLPQVLFSYWREVYPDLTLDTELRTSMQHMDFLDPQRLDRDTADQEARTLMKITYTDTIPASVLRLLAEAAPGRRLLHRRA